MTREKPQHYRSLLQCVSRNLGKGCLLGTFTMSSISLIRVILAIVRGRKSSLMVRARPAPVWRDVISGRFASLRVFAPLRIRTTRLSAAAAVPPIRRCRQPGAAAAAAANAAAAHAANANAAAAANAAANAAGYTSPRRCSGGCCSHRHAATLLTPHPHATCYCRPPGPAPAPVSSRLLLRLSPPPRPS